MRRHAFGVGARVSAAGAWRVGVVGCALLLAACGGNAQDRDREPELRDLGNRVPGVFEFPEGGRAFGGASGLTSAQFAPDHTGALWFVGCDGLFVVDDGQARFYDASISALPEGMTRVTVDANNRKWIVAGGPGGGTLGVFEQGQFRPVLEETGYMQLASAANGVVWAHYPDRATSVPVIRQVAPTLGEPLQLPLGSSASSYNASTDHDGALWLGAWDESNRGTGYRWSNGAWSAPFAMSSDLWLQYTAEEDVLWSVAGALQRDIRRVSWAGSRVEERFERGLEQQQATLAGFGVDERQLWIQDEELLWVEDGAAQDRQTMPGRVREARVSWGGAIYVFTDTTLYRQQDGALTEVLDLLEFSGGCR